MMRGQHIDSRSQNRRLLALLAAIAMILSMMVIYAQPARAHHPVVDADLVCNVQTDNWEIEWTVDNSETTSGTNRVMTVTAVSSTGTDAVPVGSFSEIVVGATVDPRPNSGPLTDSHVAAKGGSYTLEIEADWPGVSESTRSKTVVVPDEDCFNPSCPTDYLEYKIENVGDGTFGPNDEFTLDVHSTGAGETFDWTSTVPVFQVIAKGGPGANVYDYSGEFSDTGLHAPVNPNNDNYYGLSHVTFCYDELPPPEPGNIIVVKEVTDGSDTETSFDFSASYDGDGFSLADGDENDSGDLDAGTYSVSEDVPEGWTQVSAVCDDESDPSSISLQAGETVTCTYTNGELATITVVKETDPLDAEDNTTFAFSEDLSGNLGDNDSDSATVQPGTYVTTEAVVAGWSLTGIVCDEGGSGDLNSRTATYVVDYGDDVTCTFTNEQLPEVLASILVTVEGVCVLDGDQGVGRISVTMSVAGGATVVIKDGDGDTLATLTDDGTVSVPEGATYTWAATANEGFEFPVDFTPSGQITIETCSEPEVLPFTGIDGQRLLGMAIILFGAGVLLVGGARLREEN